MPQPGSVAPSDLMGWGIVRPERRFVLSRNHLGSQKFTIRSNLETAAHNPFRSSWERGCAVIRNNCLNVSSVGFGLCCCRPVLWDPRLNRAVDSAALLKRLHNTSLRSLPEIILYPDATNSDIQLSGDLGGMRLARYVLGTSSCHCRRRRVGRTRPFPKRCL